MKRDIARELFRSYRTKTNNREITIGVERSSLNEPEKLSSLLGEIVERRDWRKGIAEGNLISSWSDVVGPEISSHCEPITLLDGKLTIRASSTAWATQLRLMAQDLLRSIQSTSAGALVEEVHIIGPTAPSWRRGARTIRGSKGPRDTYG